MPRSWQPLDRGAIPCPVPPAAQSPPMSQRVYPRRTRRQRLKDFVRRPFSAAPTAQKSQGADSILRATGAQFDLDPQLDLQALRLIVGAQGHGQLVDRPVDDPV